MELKGSQTETNLMCAFAGESQARNRYTYYASAAKKEGLVQISDIFTETATRLRDGTSTIMKSQFHVATIDDCLFKQIYMEIDDRSILT